MRNVYANQGAWLTGPAETGTGHRLPNPIDPLSDLECALLRHMSDGKPRTMREIMGLVDVWTSGPLSAPIISNSVIRLVLRFQLEYEESSDPPRFRRPPGFQIHASSMAEDRDGRPLAERVADMGSLCGYYDEKHDTLTTNREQVTCLACQEYARSRDEEEDAMGAKPRTNTDTKPKKTRKKLARTPDPVNSIVADGVRRQLANALIAARNRGEKIVQGACMHCGEKSSGKSCCILCAFAHARDQELDEATAAKMLMVPERWMLDLISGFDKDGDKVTYKAAKLLGAKLWRQYGKA